MFEQLGVDLIQTGAYAQLKYPFGVAESNHRTGRTCLFGPNYLSCASRIFVKQARNNPLLILFD